ncbi:MAG: sarcosine oxidase subunit gamma [Rhodoblastus sp.]|nr:MAG: sarcosine oxidase subunit gamma [Rhodoblastus sp.]
MRSLSSRPSPRGPLDGATLPDGEAFALARAQGRASVFARRRGRGAGRRRRVRGGASGSPGVASAGSRAALWLGPDEWLLVAEGERPDALAAALAAAIGDRPHSLVDVSQRQIGLDVAGPLAARASAGCPLDLREAAFPVGFATRTMLAKSEIVLWRRGPNAYRVEVWRSFADYVAAFLAEAARRAPA